MSRPVTIIVLAWNRWDLTRACLDSLFETELHNVDVMVVDNGSSDSTPDNLRADPRVQHVLLPENLGFVRGNNAGIKTAGVGSDVILVNNDIIFTQHDWLERLRDCVERNPEAGVIGCRLVLPDGRLLHAGTYVLPDTMVGQQIGALERDVNQYPRDRKVQGIVFALAYIRREVLDRIGPLSTEYESFFEDTDYCLRAANAGFTTVVCGDVTLVHDEHGSTSGKREQFDDLYLESRRRFSRIWGAELQANYRHRLLWQSIMNFPTGYAASCRQYLTALDHNGIRVAYRYVYGRGTVFPKEEPENAEDYRLNLYRDRKVTRRDRSIGVVYGQGDVFHRNRGRYKIGYTMLEVDGFPSEWVRQANRMDEVWVPSDFNRKTFIEGGVRRPVHVMPLGVDTDHFSPEIANLPEPTGDFVFLTIFEWGERKEPWLLLKIFNDEFRADEPVRLVCKIMNRDGDVDLRGEIRKLTLSASGGRLGFIINYEFPYSQLGVLYRSASCYVSAGRGEGWDMPLMEAMACGLPSIATDWGAHREFVHSGISYPLEIRGTVPALAKCPYYEGFQWADPDPDHLRQLLRQVYEHQDEARQRGAAAAREMATKWTWDMAAQRVVRRLDDIR